MIYDLLKPNGNDRRQAIILLGKFSILRSTILLRFEIAYLVNMHLQLIRKGLKKIIIIIKTVNKEQKCISFE